MLRKQNLRNLSCQSGHQDLPLSHSSKSSLTWMLKVPAHLVFEFSHSCLLNSDPLTPWRWLLNCSYLYCWPVAWHIFVDSQGINTPMELMDQQAVPLPEEMQTCFPPWLPHSAFPPTGQNGCLCFQTLPAFVAIRCIQWWPFSPCEVISHCGFHWRLSCLSSWCS